MLRKSIHDQHFFKIAKAVNLLKPGVNPFSTDMLISPVLETILISKQSDSSL
jgi:hypothetical protein